MFGKTKLCSIIRKNKLPYPYGDTSATRYGITFTDNGDGTITVNGTAEKDTYFYITGRNGASINLEPGDYILTGCPKGGSKSTYRLYVHDATDNNFYSDKGAGISFTAIANHRYSFYIAICSTITVSNLTFKPMLRPASIADDTWEPYTGSIPSPNPNYPQELKSVGDSGSVEQVVCGKNLLDGVFELGAISSENGGNMSTTVSTRTVNYIPITPNTTYTISREITGSNIRTRFYDKDKNYIEYGFAGTNSPKTFTTKDSYCYMRLELANGKVDEKVQMELGAYATEYEPYKTQSLTIPTPNGLPGVPVSSGGNYTDENGQQYVSDYKDYERMVYVQRIHQGEITADLNIKRQTVGSNAVFCVTGLPVGLEKRYSCTETLCSHLIHSLNPISGLKGDDSITAFKNSEGIGCLYFIMDRFSSVDELKTWLADNPMQYAYPLETPIETPLSAEEIEAYKALHTNYPVTTIYNSDGAHTEVEYVANTKNYIDNKFAELQANILSATE